MTFMHAVRQSSEGSLAPLLKNIPGLPRLLALGRCDPDAGRNATAIDWPIALAIQVARSENQHPPQLLSLNREFTEACAAVC